MEVRENNEAVILAVNDRGDTVFVGYEEYRRMKARIELLEIFSEADEDVSADNRKNLVLYKMDEKETLVTVYAVVDQIQDYLNIIREL